MKALWWILAGLGCLLAACGIPTTTEPFALDDSARVTAGESIDIPVLANDRTRPGVDVEVEVEEPSRGVVTVLEGGIVRYTADAASAGVETFSYTIRAAGQEDRAMVSVDVEPAPVFELEADRRSIDFELVEFGDERIEPVTVANAGTGNLQVERPELTGPFAVVETDCGGILSPAESCVVHVGFRPPPRELGSPADVTFEEHEAVLRLETDEAGGLEVALAGTSGFSLPELVAELREVDVVDFVSFGDFSFRNVVIRLQASVVNRGTAPTETDFPVQLEIVGQEEPFEAVQTVELSIAPGGTAELMFDVPMPTELDARYTAAVHVDPCDREGSFCRVPEFDELNNTTTDLELNPVVAVSDVELWRDAEVTSNLESNFADLVADAVLDRASQVAEELGAGRVDVSLIPALFVDNYLPLASDLSIIDSASVLGPGELRRFRLRWSVLPLEVVFAGPVSPTDLSEIVQDGLKGSESGRFLQVGGFGYDWCFVDGERRVTGVRLIEGPPLERSRYSYATVTASPEGAVGARIGPDVAATGSLLPDVLVDYVSNVLQRRVTGDAYPPDTEARVRLVSCEP